MGKLKELAAEPVSLPDRFKISARRLRLAGIGLFSKVDAERSRLYRQILDLGDGYGDHDSMIGRLSVLGTGTVNLVLEESQRLFDELVEAGEQALEQGGQASRSASSRLATPRPVARGPAPKLVSSSRPAGAAAGVSNAASNRAKPELKPVARPASAADADLQQRFLDAKSRVTTLTSPPDQLTMLSLYALFKQATEGDVTGRRPGMTKIVERAKFDERQKIKGMTQAEAMQRYIAKVDSLFQNQA